MSLYKFKIKKHHKQHHDQSDCGVVCLTSILSYYNKYKPLEELRELSGTNKTGTTMLGLIQCARKIGFDADGYEANVEVLKGNKDLCILHIVKDKILQHYIVCYGYSDKKQSFIIGDPARKSLEFWSETQLDELWNSKALILIKPTSSLIANIEKPNKYKWVISKLKKDVNIISMSFLLGVIVAVLGLSSAIFSQKFIDSLLPSKNINTVIFGGILLLFLMLISGFFSYVKQLFLIRQGRDFSIRILDYFYTKLLNLPKLFFDSRKIGDLTARMNDTNRIQNTITSFISNIIVHLLMMLVSIIAIFAYSWKLGVLSLLWIPLLIVVVWYYHPKIIIGQRQVMQSYAQNESNYIDTIKGIDVIKSTNSHNIFIPQTIGIFTHYRNQVYNLGKLGIQYQFVLQIIGAFFVVGLILYSTHLVFNNEFSSGGVIALIQLATMLMSSAVGIATLNIQLQEANIALNRMFEYTSIKREDSDGSNNNLINQIESINLKNISFGFAGRAKILNSLSFQVRRGQCLGLVGEIGCGKSTLLNIVQRFYEPDEGEIIINEEVKVNDLNINFWRSIVGVVHQDTHIFNGTVIQNIALDVQKEKIDNVIDFCGKYPFAKFIEKLPQGYFTIIGEEGVNLSGGQKQVVSFLRVLYKKPRILLLDEVTSSMDTKTAGMILETIRQIKKDMPIMLVTHDLKIVESICDIKYEIHS